ncbi:MAG: hypothetical protein KDC70_19415 [Saprospiraceae bacterium]|nr:hypothetical protein [Saprospiraceae bacterium]
MKERPILFTGPMVRAILDGRKTQTRRAFSKKLIFDDRPDAFKFRGFDDEGRAVFFVPPNEMLLIGPINIKSPYGLPGDRLWVRETWADLNADFSNMGPQYVYRADGQDYGAPVTWRPSIHMPRAACRLLLDISDLRVQRLHDISEEDAIAEGVSSFMPGPLQTFYRNYLTCKFQCLTAVASFQSLWTKINGPESWAKNPWVWTIKFKRIQP